MDIINQQTFPAQVRAVGDAARIATLKEILRSDRVLDPSVLESNPPFFWRAEISSSRLDAYFTFMLASSLQNYAREAAAGVAFLPGHDHRHLPIGGSLTGVISGENEASEVHADFYTLAEMQIGSVATNGLIASIRGGLTRDVSIGWYGGRMICQLCGQDYWRGRCPHIAGLTYEEEIEGVVRQRLATVGIDDAHLAEVSGVYEGATPGAMIEKVYELAVTGAITVDDVRQAQMVYRLDKSTTERMLSVPALQKNYAVSQAATSGSGKDSEMEEDDVKRVRATFARLGIVESGDLAADIEAMGERLVTTTARAAELESRAADGDTYRNDLVAEALAEGVRAYGNTFDSATYEATLRAAPLNVIKRMRDDWQATGNARFQGGRSTAEAGAEVNNGQVVELRAPAAHYG